MKTVRFNGWVGELEKAVTINGRLSLRLVDGLTGEPIVTCTVDVPEEPQENGEVFIKNYSENSGMVDALVKAGVIYPTHRKFPSGFVQIEVCKLV